MERQAAERVGKLLGGRTEVRTLNDLSNLADAVLGYRQAEKADSSAALAVEAAEQALAAARRSGNPESIRLAEAQLREASRSAEGALMGSIGAAEAMLGTGRMAGQQRKLARAEEDAVQKLASALRFQQELKDAEGVSPLTPRERGYAMALEVFTRKYEENLRKAAGDPERLADLNEGFGALVAAAEEQVPRRGLAANRYPLKGAQDASFAPPIPVGTGPEVSLEELRRQNLKRLDNDKSTLEEEYEQRVRSPRGRGRDPRLEETREGYLKAVEEAERVLSDDKSTEADVMAALIAKNSARLAYQAARNPNPSDPGPFVAGASTFLEEAGSRALSLMSLGGFAAVKKAMDSGRLDGRSGPLDVMKVYLRGVANGITLGGLDAFTTSYESGKGLTASLEAAFVASTGMLVGAEEMKILADPKASAWQKSEAAAALVARLAGFGALGISRTRFAKMEISNPFAGRPTATGTSPGIDGGILAPKTRGITADDSPYLIRFDPRVPNRPDPRWSIDTSSFTDGVRTAGGGIRNAAEFWKRWLEARPETISSNNRFLIEQLQRNPRGPSPRIDAQWTKYFPEHSRFLKVPYKSRVIVHHHVNQGPIAIPVPGMTHVGSGGPWH
jgi:hypothetical protein